LTLGKVTSLSSVFYLTFGKAFFAECFHCRVPEKKHSAKPPILGKEVDPVVNKVVIIKKNSPNVLNEVRQENPISL
jgi:hypothetical protein